MNIVINSESEEEGDFKTANENTNRSIEIKKKGHFRGESFGNSIPVDNTLRSRNEVVNHEYSENDEST